MNFLKNRSFFIFSVMVSIVFVSTNYSADPRGRTLLVPEDRSSSHYDILPTSIIPAQKMRRPRMPSPARTINPIVMYHPSSMNNSVMVKCAIKETALISLETLPITIQYKTQQQNLAGEKYLSEEIVVLPYCDGFKQCSVARNQSRITFKPDDAEDPNNITLEVEDSDIFTISEKMDNYLYITKNSSTIKVATFMFKPAK